MFKLKIFARIVLSAVLQFSTIASSEAAVYDSIFTPIVPKLRSQTTIPLLLPTDISNVRSTTTGTVYASILEQFTNSSKYVVEVSLKSNCGLAHFCTLSRFEGELAANDILPPSFGITVQLSNGYVGRFVEGQCGSSCGTSLVSWIAGQYRYTVISRFEPTPKNLVTLANSMIASTSSSVSMIEFFRDFNEQGPSLSLTQTTADLRALTFNDVASSVSIASGRWELCTNINFGGTCVTLGPGTYPNLSAFKLNDNISSVKLLGP